MSFFGCKGMDDSKIWKVQVNHDPIVVVGDVIVLQEKIEPLFSSPCLKIAITQKKTSSTYFQPFFGSSPEGVNDLYFHTYGEFSPPPSPMFVHASPPIQILASRPKSQSRGSNPSLEAQIPPSRLGLRPHG